RMAYLLHDERPSLALAAYETATGDRSARQHGPRVIDYYGPSRTIPTVSLYQALEPQTYLPPGFFQDKIVFVGASRVAATNEAEETASFRTPYRGSRSNTFGVELHATVAGNLLEGRRIDPLSPMAAAALMLLFSAAASLVFISLRPLIGAAALFGLAVI